MPTEILSGVHDITCDEGPHHRYRSFLFEDPVATLVDAGLETSTDALFDGIDEVGVEPERVLLTHGDLDHAGGLEAVVERYDVESWVPEQTLDRADVDLGVSPDNEVTDGTRIGAFEAVHVPGHEPDNYAYVDEDRGLVVPGDALNGADRRGLPPGYLILPPGNVSEDLNEAEANLERLLDYEFDTALVFHGSSVTENARDRLDAFVNYGSGSWIE